MKKSKRKKSTALVRRKPMLPARRYTPPALELAVPMLPADPMMVPTFVGTMNLTHKQIAALRRPVEDREVEWKPAVKDGPPIIPYLSHNGYRDRLDEAFGLGGWGMVPVGMPKEKDGVVYVPYALAVGGTPRIYAWGEQEMHKMSYGDALEGAKSNAILRCGKELGIARELWSRSYIAALKERVQGTPRDGARPRAGSDVKAGEKISKPQRQRLWVIVRKSGRSEAEISVWLKAQYNLDSTKDITRGQYDVICRAIEKPGALPRPEQGEGRLWES